MSRISSAIVLAMLVLTGAMGLKTVVTTHGDSSVLMANGTAPVPPTPWKNGTAPVPPTPWKNGTAPVPPTPVERHGTSSANTLVRLLLADITR